MTNGHQQALAKLLKLKQIAEVLEIEADNFRCSSMIGSYGLSYDRVTEMAGLFRAAIFSLEDLQKRVERSAKRKAA